MIIPFEFDEIDMLNDFTCITMEDWLFLSSLRPPFSPLGKEDWEFLDSESFSFSHNLSTVVFSEIPRNPRIHFSDECWQEMERRLKNGLIKKEYKELTEPERLKRKKQLKKLKRMLQRNITILSVLGIIIFPIVLLVELLSQLKDFFKNLKSKVF